MNSQNMLPQVAWTNEIGLSKISNVLNLIYIWNFG